MDFSKKNPSSDSHVGIANPTPFDFQMSGMGFWKEVAEETNENEIHSHRGFAVRLQDLKKVPKKKYMSTTISAASKKKILAERNNDEPPLPDSCHTYFETTPLVKPMLGSDRIEPPSQITPLSTRVCSYGNQKAFSCDSSHSVPYDPVTNYTSPRPEFLRYNPNRRKEILQRIEGEMRNEVQGLGIDSRSSSDLEKPIGEESSSVSSASSKQSFQDKEFQEAEEDDSYAEVDDAEEEEVEEKPCYSRTVWKLLILFGVLLFSSQHFSSMSSSSPPFQEYGGSRVNLPKEISDRNLFFGSLLETLMGLSNMCLDVRELTCGFEGIGSNLLLSDDSFKWEDSKEKNLHDEVANVNLGDSATGDEGINSYLLMADEVTRMVNPEENESHEGVELAAERDEAMFAEDGILSGDDSVAEGKSEDPVGSREFLVQELYSEREGSGKEEILGAETMETCNIPHLISESVQDSQTQFVFDDSPTRQDAEWDPFSSFQTETISRKEAQGEESAELSESLLVPQSRYVPSLSSDDQNIEGSEFPTIYEAALQWKHGSVLVWKVQLLYLLISSLMVIIGISIVLFFKYFAKSHENSLLVSPPSCNLLPCSVSVNEKRISPAVPVMEDLGDKHNGSNTNPKPLDFSIDEQKEFYATRSPTVELLGEFSLVEAIFSEIGSGQKLKIRRSEEDFQLSQSQRRRGPEELQLSQSQRRPIRKNLSPPTNKVHAYPSVESTSNGSYTAEEKLPRKEDIGGRDEVKKVVATPVRRSSRLRNRVTSPLADNSIV